MGGIPTPDPLVHADDRRAQQFWGLRYIDDAAIRRVRAYVNTAAPEDPPSFEWTGWEHFWYVTDAQFSVVALLDDVGDVVERVSYDAYGNARHRRPADLDGDRDVDAPDLSAYPSSSDYFIGDSGYSADFDLNRDGSEDDINDYLDYLDWWFPGNGTAALPDGHISETDADAFPTAGPAVAPDNPIGYCGYIFNPETQLYLARNRWYSPGLGRWLERDPAGYVGGANLYGYVGGGPLMSLDPYGLDPWMLSNWVGRTTGAYWLGGGLEVAIDMTVDNAKTLINPAASSMKTINSVKGMVSETITLTETYTDGGVLDYVATGAAVATGMQSLADGVYGYDTLTGEQLTIEERIAGVAEGVAGAAGAAAGGLGALESAGARCAAAATATDEGALATRELLSDIGCFVAGTQVLTADGTSPIETIRAGDRVIAGQDADCETSVDPATWRHLTLLMPHPYGADSDLEFDLLRPVVWMEMVGAEAGQWIDFEFEELQISGPALVLSVEPCPEIADAPGRVVLGTMTHVNGFVLQLRFAGLAAPIQLTRHHQLYSLDRQEWLPARLLHVGERLERLNGSAATLTSITILPGQYRVYNLEVEADHRYCISALQILAHNNNPCAADIPGNPFKGESAAQDAYKHLEKYHGVEPEVASERLHLIKDKGGLGAADNAVIGRTGDVYHPVTGEHLGSLTQN